MIYEPWPFKRCTKCGNDYLPTRRFFGRAPHHKDRLTSQCHKCISAYKRKWQKANPDKVRQYERKHYANYPEQERAKNHRQYHRNIEKYRAYARKGYYKNIDKVRGRRKRYHAKHRDALNSYVRLWRKRHPEYDRERYLRALDKRREQARRASHKRSHRKRKLPATFKRGDWEFALDYFGYQCAYCSRPQGLWHTLAQDHFYPVSKGYGYTPDNIIPACHGLDGCNNQKSSSDPFEWMERKFGKRKATQIAKRIEEFFEQVRGKGR